MEPNRFTPVHLIVFVLLCSVLCTVPPFLKFQEPIIDPVPPPTNDAEGTIEAPAKIQTQLLQEVGETRVQPSLEATLVSAIIRSQ